MQFALAELKESHQWLFNYHSKMLQMMVHQIDAASSSLKTLSEHGRKTGKLKSSKECNTFLSITSPVSRLKNTVIPTTSYGYQR
jgi:hypothetical protein